ncbi:conjugal transfer protein TraA, partial [Escherichia coli]|nr:conjugal transfer protein TraA [Escherichia coli]
LISFVESVVPVNGDIKLSIVVYFFLITIISIFLIEQVGTLCSTLTGGVGINGLTSAANGFGGKVASGFMRASGLRSFTNGFASKMPNPFFNAGSRSASALVQGLNRGSKLKAG